MRVGGTTIAAKGRFPAVPNTTVEQILDARAVAVCHGRQFGGYRLLGVVRLGIGFVGPRLCIPSRIPGRLVCTTTSGNGKFFLLTIGISNGQQITGVGNIQ